MNIPPTTNPNPSRSIFRNWLSLSGLVLMASSIFAFLLLFFLDTVVYTSNPYVGILTFLIAPMFFMAGLVIFLFGAWRWRRRLAKSGAAALALHIDVDLSRRHDRRMLAFFIPATAGFLLLTAMGSYHSYHFTESVEFCGEACHKVMEPEFTRYRQSSHARVACAECHIGKGAEWYVRSKLSGTYQVYSVMAHKYPTPIPTPIRNLRPAQETCEQCHWPKKFVGNLDRTISYYLPDKTNTLYSLRLLLKVGGGDPTHGPVGGIHWHMNVGRKIEYIATDAGRQKIPWVRSTDLQGNVTEYHVADFTNDVSQLPKRTMDCMDCHNRPAHKFQSPESAVNLAMALGQIDTGLAYIKTNAVGVLCRTYTDETNALQTIATTLAKAYPEDPRIQPAIAAVQQIYRDNFFPEMKADWRGYPDNIGHKDWPGCFRCHDGKHLSTVGQKSIKGSDCNACHLILAQGNGEQLNQLSPQGLKFAHPIDEYDPAFQCTDCHNGGM
ncbi:MAG TPA: NapC/NirT family cytochrome c [Verrucomicrobiae bacterium]|jgi:nitrate/TMAO reductase-like tetraheme cytochrome c subunit|nr:NapC/NirT family cytochrome c [Verrucomicrobiae bacterium]